MVQTILQSNPKANYLAHKEEIDSALARMLESGWYILGQEVSNFEKEFAAYIGVEHAMGVATGTDALLLALRACGIGPGDLVFTVSHTAVATVTAIGLSGATPVFVDIDPATYTMDAGKLEDAIKKCRGGKPRAIIPVHLYGHPADMAAIGALAMRHDLRIVEDCAQSHGAMFRGKKTGSLGDLGAFSFYPTKNLGALGDGGAVVTNDADLAAQLRLLREYGWRERYISHIAGYNSRLDELQASILRVKLRYLDADNSRRQEIARQYTTLLAGTDLTLPQMGSELSHVFHQYVIRARNRDGLKDYLKEQGIGSLIHYPMPVHLQPAYASFTGTSDLSHTESVAGEILSLPIYPEFPLDHAQVVCGHIMNWLGD